MPATFRTCPDCGRLLLDNDTKGVCTVHDCKPKESK